MERPLWKRPVCCRKQRQRVTEQGYLALDGICPQDEVGYIRATLMDMFENRTGYNEGAQYDFISRDDPSRPARFPSLHDPRHYAPTC